MRLELRIKILNDIKIKRNGNNDRHSDTVSWIKYKLYDGRGLTKSQNSNMRTPGKRWWLVNKIISFNGCTIFCCWKMENIINFRLFDDRTVSNKTIRIHRRNFHLLNFSREQSCEYLFGSLELTRLVRWIFLAYCRKVVCEKNARLRKVVNKKQIHATILRVFLSLHVQQMFRHLMMTSTF